MKATHVYLAESECNDLKYTSRYNLVVPLPADASLEDAIPSRGELREHVTCASPSQPTTQFVVFLSRRRTRPRLDSVIQLLTISHGLILMLISVPSMYDTVTPGLIRSGGRSGVLPSP